MLAAVGANVALLHGTRLAEDVIAVGALDGSDHQQFALRAAQILLDVLVSRLGGLGR